MTNLFRSQTNFRLLPPELIWLEPEQLAQAKVMSETSPSEPQQWQSYLNALSLLGFEQWFSNRLPECEITRAASPLPQGSPKFIESACYVEVNGFTICLIAVEHVLDETVRIPQIAVEQSDLAAHFYVLQEVSEEQELVTMRGFCRHDELIDYRNRYSSQIQDSYYLLPLTFLDAEPNHLLMYCRALKPAAIAPTESIAVLNNTFSPTENYFVDSLNQRTTQLTKWLQDMFDQGWQAIDQFINPEVYLSFSTRNLESGARRGKLISLGAQLGRQTVALLVNVTSEAEGKVGVLVQLHPTGEAQYLMANLNLSLRSQTGKILQEVTARSQDNYIQLKPFKGLPGTRFSVAIHLNGDMVEENFEL